MAAVRASTRISISWKGAESYEDTDTLVLTINSWSLDLRVVNTGPRVGQIDWSTVARVTELPSSTSGQLQPIYLAIYRKYPLVFADEYGMTENPQLRWDHIIDSRPPTDMEDHGVFTNLPDGDVEERGLMYNPISGEYEEYIERWRRYKGLKGGRYCVLERVNGEKGEKSYIGCVGDEALGLQDNGKGGYSAYRAERRGESWVRVFEQDARGLPDLPNEIPESWQEGCEVDLGESEWVVRTVGTV
jgi:hypothetical protein